MHVLFSAQLQQLIANNVKIRTTWTTLPVIMKHKTHNCNLSRDIWYFGFVQTIVFYLDSTADDGVMWCNVATSKKTTVVHELSGGKVPR